MHFWGEPTYIDNILQFFVIINHEKKLINNEVIARTAQFFFVVMIAKMKKDLMIRRISIESILSRVKRSSAKYFEVLSFKYELSKATILEVIEIELLAEFLIKLTWTQEKALKDGRVTNLIRRDTAEDMMKSFEYFDFWFMRYKDVVQEGYKKAEDVVLDEDREESSAGGLGGGRKY
jgi:hypothetical protein